MYVSALPSDTNARQRSHGRVELVAENRGGQTRVAHLHESGPSRLRLPRAMGGELEAVLINTGGGVACGDRYDFSITAGEGASLAVTTPGAEKVYRSDGPVAHLGLRMEAGPGASLAWLPQETIFFDTARLRRSFDVDLAPDARLLMVEMMVFGRAAFAEEVREGFLEDRWRIRRGGRLVYADTFRLSGALGDLLKRPTVLGGARAMATVIYVAPDAETRLEEAREVLARKGDGTEQAATVWNGMLAARFLTPTIADLRRHVVHFTTRFRRKSMPRVWQV